MSQTQTALPERPAAPLRGQQGSAQLLYDKCIALANNLWWTWQPEVVNLFRGLRNLRRLGKRGGCACRDAK